MLVISKKGLGFLAFVVVCLVWGTTYFAIKLGVQTIPPFLFNAIRQLIAGVLLLLLVFMTGGKRDWSINNLKKQVQIGFLLFCMGNGLLSWAEVFIPSGLAALIVSLVPLNIVLWNLLLSKDKVWNVWIAAGIFVGLLGMVFIFKDNLKDLQNANYALGIGVTVFGTFCWALGTVFIKKYNHLSKASFHNVSLQLLSAGIIMLPFAVLMEKPGQLQLASTSSLWALAYLILFGSILTLLCYQYAIQTLPVSTVALYAYINPLVALVLGVFILDEHFTVFTAIAFALTIIGIYLVNHGNNKFQQKKNEPQDPLEKPRLSRHEATAR